MKDKKDKSDNLATPGKPMSQKKFAELIKEAEDGEFRSLAESKKQFDEWRKKIAK